MRQSGYPAGLILFADDFDRPEQEAGAQPEVIPPTFRLEDLALAREEAWAEGHSAATVEGDARREDDLRRSAAGIAAQLSSLRSELKEQADAQAQAVAQLLLKMVAALFPALCASHGEAEATALVRALLPGLTHQPPVTIRTHPRLADRLNEEIAAVEGEVDGIKVVPTDSVPLGDVRISWQGGSAVRDAKKLWQRVSEVLAEAGLAVPLAIPTETVRELEHAA